MSAEQLVMIVKAGQRSNQEVKNRWAEYCLKECDGTKDPAKHSAESLGNFLHMIEAEFQHESWLKKNFIKKHIVHLARFEKKCFHAKNQIICVRPKS